MKNQTKFLFVLCICSVICIISESAPLDDFSEEVDEYEEEGEEEEEVEERIRFGNLLDDMLVDVTKNGVLAPTAVWPNATVRYKIAPAFGNIYNIWIYILSEIHQHVARF